MQKFRQLQGFCVLESAQVAVQESRCTGGHTEEHDTVAVYPVLLW